MKHYDLDFIELRGLKFEYRRDTSDLKAIKEVVGRRAYRRKDFPLESDRWVDLGANIGAFTCLVAAAGASVTAYEPDPMCVALLERNVELNGLGDRVEIVQAAVVADERREVVLHLNSSSGNFWRNSLVKQWRGGESIAVPAVSLKSLSTDADCKMDIEGSEMQLLEDPALPRWQRLVFEWSFDIDPSIARFKRTVERLNARYGLVRYAKFDETQAVWSKTWFPPCRTIWCDGDERA